MLAHHFSGFEQYFAAYPRAWSELWFGSKQITLIVEGLNMET